MPDSPCLSIEQIRQRLRGGFRPFVLHLSDGRKFEVPHPEFILVTGHSVAVANERGLVEILDPVRIVSIGELECSEDRPQS